MVRSDFTFRAPLVEAGSKDDFFAGAEAKAGLIRGYRLLRQWHDKDEVSTLYEVDVRTSRGEASVLLHEWHTVSSGRLAASVMVFDTASRAAQLMHEALKDIDG